MDKVYVDCAGRKLLDGCKRDGGGWSKGKEQMGGKGKGKK